MAERRLKHWGWGYEDQQPSHDEVVAAAEGIRAHLGFGDGDVERPVALEDVDLRAPRIEPPVALACAVDPHARASHALGKAYRDVVRGFRGEFAEPPDVVARPRDEADVERWLSWCADEGAVAIPFGGGTSVVGGVEARGIERPVVSLDLRGLEPGASRSIAHSRAALIQGGATGPVLEEQLKQHGLTLRHYPQSFEYSTLGRLDRHPGGRALRHALDAHRRPRGVGARDHARRALGEPAASRAPGPGRARTGC